MRNVGAVARLLGLLLIIAVVAATTSFEPGALDARENYECFVFSRLLEDTPIVSSATECRVKAR